MLFCEAYFFPPSLHSQHSALGTFAMQRTRAEDRTVLHLRHKRSTNGYAGILCTAIVHEMIVSIY